MDAVLLPQVCGTLGRGTVDWAGDERLSQEWFVELQGSRKQFFQIGLAVSITVPLDPLTVGSMALPRNPVGDRVSRRSTRTRRGMTVMGIL